MNRQSGFIYCVGWFLVFTSGCATTGIEVARVANTEQTDLSGKWNDTDARLVSENLIEGCFVAPWYNRFMEAEGRRPALRVRSVVNKTDEHIDSQVFIKNIERSIVNSGKARILAQVGQELGAIEGEQERAISGRQSDDTSVSVGNETGADFVIALRVTSMLDQVSGKKAKLYKVTFELLDSTTTEKAWIGDYEIKKVIRQSRVGW